MNDQPAAIEIVDVHRRFGRKRVLQGVTLSVPRGATTVLLGANGEGKSTLLRIALGVLKPQRGSVHIKGVDPIRDREAAGQTIGYVPDVPDAYGWMRLPDLFRYLAPHYRRWDDAHAHAIAKRLDAPLTTPFRHMSRGQGMKAMLAAALGHHPDVLLLDEPFAGLDPLVREEVLRGVIRELGDGTRTVLLTTHDLEVASRVADRIAVLAEGVIRSDVQAGELSLVGDEATPRDLHRAMAEALSA